MGLGVLPPAVLAELSGPLWEQLVMGRGLLQRRGVLRPTLGSHDQPPPEVQSPSCASEVLSQTPALLSNGLDLNIQPCFVALSPQPGPRIFPEDTICVWQKPTCKNKPFPEHFPGPFQKQIWVEPFTHF